SAQRLSRDDAQQVTRRLTPGETRRGPVAGGQFGGIGIVSPCALAIPISTPRSGSTGDTSRATSVKNSAAPARDVTEIISPPIAPKRNQCVVPAGTCTSVPAPAASSGSWPTPKITSPLIT